ncbi:MAG: hypothetical protein H6835_02685 [Planctomycetes bacterium]|nr:hypothetical protein [Planctomycetota bacterium]
MNPIPSRIALSALVAAAALCGTLPAQSQTLWSNPWSNYTTIVSRVCTQPAADFEAADDFDVTGTITRIVVGGHGCTSCLPPAVTGAWVRFYDGATGSIGALQYEQFVPAGTGDLQFDPLGPEGVDVTLPLPFAAAGRHFVSVQLAFAGDGYWSIWVSSYGAPRLSGLRVRDRLGSNQWYVPQLYPWSSPPVNADLTFTLWGLPPGSGGTAATACVTWSPQTVEDHPGSSHTTLRDIKVFSREDVWAVGQSQVTVAGNSDSFTTVVHWDGHGYQIVPSPSPGTPGLINCYLNAVDGVSSSDLWVGGTYQIQVAGGWVGQQVFAMHYDGQTWTVPADLPLPNTGIGGGISGSTMTAIEAIAADDVWMVGDWLDIQSTANPITIRPGLLLHYDGQDLEQTLLPIVTGVGHQFFSAIDSTASDDVWVAGGAGAIGSPPSTVPVLFHFDGSGWTHVTVPTPSGYIRLNDVEALSSNEVFVSGTATVGAVVTPFMVLWNGSSWTLLPGPPGGGDMVALSGGLLWAGGSSAWFWNGSQWLEQFDVVGSYGGAITSIDAVDPCELYGAGARFGAQIRGFAARQDNSTAWNWRTRLPMQPTRAPCRLSALSAVRPGELLTVGIDDPAGVTAGAGSPTLWLVGTAAAPVGAVVPFGGVGGGPGEVLVDPSTIGFGSTLVTLPAVGEAQHSVPLPANPALVGVLLVSQGVVVDLAAPHHLLLTNALDLQIGW